MELTSWSTAKGSADAALTSGASMPESMADIKKLLKQMFEVGGVSVRNGGYTDFVFRRVSGAGFSTRYEFIRHDALTRAWNRPWR
ncbi:hypothetical protein ARTHRO9V_350001 [Arthrobacter sp. 9V]|jgi:hypothetical protein|nr:hypothetical protein CURTO8I2_220044 [Curtobacterium sp. 8I-2]VXC54942.1 hypothetical protein ARTHRO9V_350001 [Arthrobacter sp. 9V]